MTPVLYCLGIADGFLGKTNKAKGFDYCTKSIPDCSLPNHNENLLIVDGNATYHMMTEIPDTFKGASEMVFKMTPGSCDAVYSTDMYVKNQSKPWKELGEVVVIKCSSRVLP